MAESIRAVDYYYVSSPDKPGAGAGVLGALRDAGVNLLAVHAFPSGRRVQVDIVPEDAKAFLKVARREKFKLSRKKKAFLVEGGDRIGVLAEILEKVAAAGINVTAATALTAGRSRYGAIFWVKPKDQRRAAKVLGV
ncbi:MAG: ACT domain-containing protein [bacterium]